MVGIDELPDGVDSLNAQVASLYVKEKHPENWEEFDEAVFESLWVEGRDIGNTEVLVDIAKNIGLNDDELRDALDDDKLRDDLRRRFLDAQEDGVAGVPTFVYGEHACRGAVPPEQLRRLVEG